MGLDQASYSKLSKFESCNYHAYLSYVQKIPEPERPLPPGKTEHANDRGTRIHEAAEKFIHGGVELIPELKHYSEEFHAARELFSDGAASTEGDWAFTKDWEPVAWLSEDVWIRIKCDLVVHLANDHAVVIDYKSGKRFGNELKHGEQMQLYVLGTIFKYPNVKTITTELWYLDLNEMATKTYTRTQGLAYLANYERRIGNMTSAEDFPPNPSTSACRFCAYKPIEKGGTGHCPVGK